MKSLKKKIKKLLNAKMRVPYITGFMPNGRKHYHFKYFGCSFKTKGAPIMISLLLKPI